MRPPGVNLINPMNQFDVGVFLFPGAVIGTGAVNILKARPVFSTGFSGTQDPVFHVFLRRWLSSADFFLSQLTSMVN